MLAMISILGDVYDNHFWEIAASCCAALVAVSAFADRRRNRRMHLEDVGFMPWTGITVMSVLLTVVAIAFAIKSYLSL
jgi:hypothetical protein